MKTKLKAFGLALCISFGLLLIFMGNILIAEGLFGNKFIWKEIIAGLILLFIGLLSAILPINYSHNHGLPSKEKLK